LPFKWRKLCYSSTCFRYYRNLEADGHSHPSLSYI
jgi:hypothetical protein